MNQSFTCTVKRSWPLWERQITLAEILKEEKKGNAAGATVYRLNEQNNLTDGGCLLSFRSSEGAERGLRFEVCGDTSTTRRLHPCRQYFS